MLVDTGVGELMSHEELLTYADYYESIGLPDGFAERAVATQMTFHRGDQTRWTACNSHVDHANPCPLHLIRENVVMSNYVPDTVTLDMFVDPENPGVFVARGCGNTSTLAQTQTADTQKTAFHLVDAPSRLEVGSPQDVRVQGTLLNEGPTETVVVDDTFTVDAPADCTVVPAQHVLRRELQADVPVDVEATFTITCGKRSFHDFVFRNDVSLVGTETDERDTTNNSRSVEWRVPVFQPTDLAVDDLRIRCGERGFGPSTFPCELSAVVVNDGPAPDVVADTTFSPATPSDCTAVPVGNQALTRVLAVDTPTPLSVTWDVTCLGAVRHVFTGTVAIASSPDDPHVEDVDESNDRARRAWVPIDVKPRSDPSSINVDKQGVVPVAILSTPDFDATSEVDVDSLRFGRTGDEESLVSCSATPEDVNDDGYPDLVCHFHTTLTGLQCGDTEAVLTGLLDDGTPFEGQDTVKIVPCKT